MLTNDDVFDAMAELRRRQLLAGLLHTDSRPVPKLSSVSQKMLQAHETILREYLSGPQEIENADKAAIRTHHVHLPKLVQYSYVEWDKDDSVVTKGLNFDDVRPLLDVVEQGRDERLSTDTAPTIQK